MATTTTSDTGKQPGRAPVVPRSLLIPAGFITSRFGYKAGMLLGLGLAAAGGLLFFPASEMLVYEMFLLALFVLHRAEQGRLPTPMPVG